MMRMAAANGVRQGVTLTVLAVGGTAFGLLQSMVAPVLPLLQREFDTTQSAVTWVFTGYLLSASVCTPVLGRLGDMVGKKKVLVGALAALAIGCLMAALASSLPVMIAARVIQGAGGGLLPLSFGIIRDEFPREAVPRAIGAVSAMLGAGGAAGLVVAGPIVDALDLTWLFWTPMVAVAAAGLAAHLFIPESPIRAPGPINWPAAGLLSGWLIALLVAVSQAPAWGWLSQGVLGLLAAAAVLFLLWVLVEARAAVPLIDMRMMRIRAVWATNVVAVVFGFAMYAGFAFVPQFLQTPPSTGYGFGATVTESGLMSLPQAIASFLLGLSAGGIAQRIGSKRLLIVGAGLTALGYSLFTVVHQERWEVYPLTALMGAGFGLAFAAMSNLVVAAVPPSQTGVASGMNANLRTIGGAIGAAVMASVVTAQTGAGGWPMESGYVAGFSMVSAALVLSALAALLVPAVRCDPVTRVEPDVPMRHPEAGLVAGGTLVGDGPE
jgi:EmrB/QacA subfamily drug resistance transporter